MLSKFRQLTPRTVGGILGLGGTILYTVRTRDFKTNEGLLAAAKTLEANEIDGLVVIGGNGSFRGASELIRETDTLVVGIPASIDNDVYGTDETIGFDTAVNTAVTEIDKIRDTAISHERIFIVEVMGRKRGFLALTVGITSGAEVILLPEMKPSVEEISQTISENRAKGKRSGIIVSAEGAGDSRRLVRQIEEHTGAEVKLSVLGYAQRGGIPTARSRLLACLFGSKAIDLLLKKKGNKLIGLQNGNITTISLNDAGKTEKPIDLNLLQIANELAT